MNGSAVMALEGDAKWKYFQHSGCLITADGSDDHLIKFEGVPDGYKVVVGACDRDVWKN